MRSHWTTRVCATVALCMVLPAVASAQGSIRVAVIANNAVNLTMDEATEVTLAISSALRQSLDATVVGDVATQAAATQAVASLEQCVIDPACVATLRGALEVDALLFVSLARVGPVTRVEVRYAAPKSNRTVQVLNLELNEAPSDQIFLKHARALVPDAQPRSTGELKVVTGPGGAFKPIPARATENEAPSRFTTPVMVVGGLTVATAIGATVLGISAISDDCNDVACDEQGVDSVNNRALVTDVLWGATIVGAAVTGYLFWKAGKERPSSQVSVVPSAGGAHVVLGGRF